MDRDHLEPGDGLHKDQRRLQALLRRANGDTAPSDGRVQIPERVRPHRSRVRTGRTTQVEKAAARVRELDERPVPRIHLFRIHRVGVPRHESGIPSHVSGAHETPGPRHAARPRADLNAEHLAGREHRIQRMDRPTGEAERSQRPHEIPVSRTIAGAVA